MNGFLVVGSGSMDDIPLRMFVTEQEAMDFAQTVTPEMVWDVANNIMSRDTSTFVSIVQVIEFSMGEPVCSTHVMLDPDLAV